MLTKKTQGHPMEVDGRFPSARRLQGPPGERHKGTSVPRGGSPLGLLCGTAPPVGSHPHGALQEHDGVVCAVV